MSSALHEARETLVDASTRNNGATRGDAKFDVDGAIGTLAYYAKLAEKLTADNGDRRFFVEGAGEPLTRARPDLVAAGKGKVTKDGAAVFLNARGGRLSRRCGR